MISLSGREIIPESKYARAFLLVTLLEAITDIALETAIITRSDLLSGIFSSSQRRPLSVYLGIFILAHLVQLYLAWDALGVKNTIQVVGLCAFNAAFLIYAIIQVAEIRAIQEEVRVALLQVVLVIIPIVIAVAQVAFVYLTWNIYREFGWAIYKQIGADRRIKRMYFVYQIFICFLKFDYFFFIGFCLQLVLLVPSVSSAEKILTIVAVPVALGLLVLAYVAVRRENRWLMRVFLAGLVAGAGYFVYKLFRIWQGRNDPESFANVFKSLTVFSLLCLFLIITTFSCGVMCLNNFDQGLKMHMTKRKGSRKETEAMDGLGMHYNLSSAQNSRMSIE